MVDETRSHNNLSDDDESESSSEIGTASLQSADDDDEFDEWLETSFQTSFRATYDNLKRYVKVEPAAPEPEAASDSVKTSSSVKSRPTPPAGIHAPHHTWLLGTYGGKRKPDGIRPRNWSPEFAPSISDLNVSAASGAAQLDTSTNGEGKSKATVEPAESKDSSDAESNHTPQLEQSEIATLDESSEKTDTPAVEADLVEEADPQPQEADSQVNVDADVEEADKQEDSDSDDEAESTAETDAEEQQEPEAKDEVSDAQTPAEPSMTDESAAESSQAKASQPPAWPGATRQAVKNQWWNDTSPPEPEDKEDSQTSPPSSADSRDSLESTFDPTPASPAEPDSIPSSHDVLRRIANTGGGKGFDDTESGAQPIVDVNQSASLSPDAFRIPPRALDAALPSDTWNSRPKENQDVSQELYAPTVEVSKAQEPAGEPLMPNSRPARKSRMTMSSDSDMTALYNPTKEIKKPSFVPQVSNQSRFPVSPSLLSDAATPALSPSKSQEQQSEYNPFASGNSTGATQPTPPAPPVPPTVSQTRLTAAKSRGLESQGGAAQGKGKKGKDVRGRSFVNKQVSNQDDGSGASAATPIQNLPAKIALSVLAIVVLIGVIGVVVQGITSGGKSWVPFATRDEWKKELEAAETCLDNGDYGGAITLLDAAIEENPSQAGLYHRRGLARLLMHNPKTYDAALKDFNESLKKNPNLLEAYFDRAAVHIELGQYELAIADYDRLLKAGKDTAKVRFGRGLAKYYDGDYMEAERDFKLSLDKAPERVEAVIALGTALSRVSNDPAGAEREYGKAHRHLNDMSGLSLRNLAILAHQQGANYLKDAENLYNDAIGVNPGNAHFFNERGIIRWHLDDPIGAAVDFKHAIARDPTLESAKDNLNFVCKELIDEGRAKIAANPKSHVGYVLVAFGLAKLGRYKDAIYYANEALNNNPQNVGCYELIGACYKDLGLFEDAIEPLTIAIKLNPTSAEAYSERAWANFKSGFDKDALADATEAIKLNNALSTPYIVRSSINLRRGDYLAALEDNNRLIQMEPKSAINYSNRALTYSQGRHFKEAESDLRRSITLDPNHWHGYVCLGRLMQDLGRDAEAIKYFNQAIELNPGQDTYPPRIYFFESQRQFDKAIADSDKLLELQPFSAGNFRRRGMTYALAGKFDEAIKNFDEAVTIKEDDVGFAALAGCYLRKGDYDEATKEIEAAFKYATKSEPALKVNIIAMLLQRRFGEAVNSANWLIKQEGWQERSTYDAVLHRWVALNYQGKKVKAREMLLDCERQAGTFPWPMPIVRYLLDEIELDQLTKETESESDVTDVHYYAGMKALFSGKTDDARANLEWVVNNGLMINIEYLLAQKGLDWMAQKDTGAKAK